MVSTSEPLNHPLDDCQLSQCYLPTLLATFFASRAWFITCDFLSFFVFAFQGNYVACLIAMLQLMDEKHYQKYVAHFSTDQDLLVTRNSFVCHVETVIMRRWTVFKLQPIRFSFVFLQFIFNSPNFEQNPFSILFALTRLVDKIKQLRSAAVKVFFSPSGLPHRTLHVVLSLCQK